MCIIASEHTEQEHTMGQEFELKYRTTPEIQEEIKAAFPGNYTVYRMETTYFDTPGGELSARRWTLRCRRENEIHVCTLKTPGQGNARGEWDTESGDIFAAVPVLARLASLPELETLAAKGFVPRCGARFVRMALPVELASGEAELALDRGVLLGGGKELPLCEMELELKSGNPEELTALAETIALRFGAEPESKSKFARAKALAEED